MHRISIHLLLQLTSKDKQRDRNNKHDQIESDNNVVRIYDNCNDREIDIITQAFQQHSRIKGNLNHNVRVEEDKQIDRHLLVKVQDKEIS